MGRVKILKFGLSGKEIAQAIQICQLALVGQMSGLGQLQQLALAEGKEFFLLLGGGLELNQA